MTGCMRSPRIGLRVGGIAAALAVLAGAALSWGTLCLGEDGHVAFEVSVAGRCFDDVRAAPPVEHPVHLDVCAQDAGCGPCTDLRGTADAWLAGVSPDLPEATPALVSVTHVALPQPMACAASSRLWDATPAARRAVTAMTVLRC